ncbi:MAG: hypothetical protein AAFU71_10525, partial [Cyanobacteria bacterium J06632_22]
MKQSQFSLSSIAIASLAFLLNWLVFVDSAPLAALTAPFEVDGASQRGNLLPTFPPDTAARGAESTKTSQFKRKARDAI